MGTEVTQQVGAYASLAEVYGGGGYARYTRALRHAGSGQVTLVRFAQPAGDFPDPPTPDYTLAINEGGTGRMRFDIGAGRIDVPFRRGDMVLKAPDVATRFAVDAAHGKSFVSLPAPLVGWLASQAGGDGRPPSLGALHAAPFRCAQLARLFEVLWAEPPGESPHRRLFEDGVLLALVARLLGLAAPRAAPPRDVAALSPERVARVEAFVRANLAESFGIEAMADEVGLSAWHFCRAFRAATGRTPRAHVTACRIEEAKRLLAEGTLPLAQVAQACGFADQAHFTTVFSRHAGATPGAWRKARKG